MQNYRNLKIYWTSDYSLGNQTIDEQHAMLFELFNSLVDAIDENHGPGAGTPAFDLLIEHTKKHFADEEQIMSRLNFPDLDEHRKSHDKLISQIISLSDDLKTGRALFVFETLLLIRIWLLEHITEEDIKLKPYFNQDRN